MWTIENSVASLSILRGNFSLTTSVESQENEVAGELT